MPFEGSQIEVRTRHTVPINAARGSLDEQIAHIEQTWRRVFQGADDFEIKVQQVDVYSADFSTYPCYQCGAAVENIATPPEVHSKCPECGWEPVVVMDAK